MKNLNIDFNKGDGLVPAIIQSFEDGQVLMLGYMSKESLEKTLESGRVYFWSRSRKKLWLKGDQSGNKFQVKEVYGDCDGDAILIKVELIGADACHTGNKTCFFNSLRKSKL